MGDTGSWPFWLDRQSPKAILLLLLDDSRSNAARPALAPALWAHIAAFLRFPAPMQMIYLFGGRRLGVNGLEVCLDSAEAFDWWSGDWVPIPSMSSARVGAAAAVLGRLVVVAGGYREHATEPLDTVEAFDPLYGRWNMLQPMPTRRYGLALANAQGKLFAIGGDDGHQVCTANEVYDETAWLEAAPLLRPLAGGKAETHAGKIYYVGGCDQNEELSAATFVYCPYLDFWDYACIPDSEDKLSLQTGRTSFAMGLIDGVLGPAIGPRLAEQPVGEARLVVTGGVSGRPDDFFLTDTELLPLAQSFSNRTAHAHTAEHMNVDAAWLGVKGVPPMPQPRSGCRSVVLWPSPQRKFLPWSLDLQPLDRTKPFVVVMGGETPSHEEGLVMQPCSEPIALDVVGGLWHAGAAEEAPAQCEYEQFLRAVDKLKTNRVAFAITLAQGLPRVAAHGG